MIGEIKANARCLGWGFLLAWVFCAFYSGSMDGSSMVVDAMGGDVARRLAVSVLPVGSAVVSLIVIVAAARPADELPRARGCRVISGGRCHADAVPSGVRLRRNAAFVRRIGNLHGRGQRTDVGDVGPAVRTLAARRR